MAISGGVGTKAIRTTYPVTEGLTDIDNYKTEGRVMNLVPEDCSVVEYTDREMLD